MPQDLQWAAFYADTEHEVLPVTEGHRITLTYNLRAVHKRPFPAPFAVKEAAAGAGAPQAAGDTKAGGPGRGTNNGQASGAAAHASGSSGGGGGGGVWMTAGDVSASAELTAEIKRLMADENWHNKGERLGFVLQQKYTAGLSDLASLPFPDSLKGPDRVLAAALTQAGLQPRVMAVFRGWTGFGDYDYGGYDDEDKDVEPAHPVNYGRPLQPAQQKDALTSEPDAYWALLVAEFGACRQEGYHEDTYPCINEDEAYTLQEVFGAEEQDICWVTPVVDNHFAYHASVLAGANTAYEVCFHATAALLVDVPSWAAGQPLIAGDAVFA